ncbi:putative PurR-regulated permease PerM [Neisseria sp. HSC-16F19]|nr:AI-2E family transporter [Neisseria sp. HSC-16F19]MCP2040177.1 putative PurR-regulated permease PerM [Neisseria sp. HSC-16F19]
MSAAHPFRPWVIAAAVVAVVLWLVLSLQTVLTPFVIAGILAYILNPLVEKLRARGLSRPLAAMSVMVITLLLLGLLLIIIVPMFVTQFENLAEKLPQFLHWLQNKALPWVNARLNTDIELNSGYLMPWLQEHMGSLREAASKAMPALMRQGSSFLVMATNFMLLPFLLYYFLLDWVRWTHGIKVLVPRRVLPVYNRITANMDRVLGEFLRGQITVMLVMGLIYGLGLMLVGLDSGFAIGMVAGLLVFIPYLGAFTGLLLATVAAVLQFDSWTGLLLVWSVFAVGQFLESFFITPKIVGDRIGLSPFWVIFALMAFGQLLGFVGMLLALPLAAMTLVLLREGADWYLGSPYYLALPQEDIPPPEAEAEAEENRIVLPHEPPHEP